MDTNIFADYPDRVQSVNDWLKEYKKYLQTLKETEGLTAERIEELKNNFFALEMLAGKYEDAKNVYAENHCNNYNEVVLLRPIVEEIIEMFQQTGDRRRYLDKISMLSLETIIKLCQRKIKIEGKGQLIPSIIGTTDAIFEIAENDISNSFVDNQTGLIAIDEITYKYPGVVKVIRDITTQAVFKPDMQGGFDKNGEMDRSNGKNTYSVKLINESPENANTENKLSYYDWAVMEAITSLYLAGNENIALSSILKVLKHNKDKGMSDVQKNDKEHMTVYESIQRLQRNHISIHDDNCGFSEQGYLINGELKTEPNTGILYLHMNSEPILYSHANVVNHINSYTMDELNLEINYNDNTIAIYRYLIAEIGARFGTIKKDELINGKKRLKVQNNAVITAKKICVDILGGERNYSKEQTIRKRIPQVLGAMIERGFISGYKTLGSGSKEGYEVYR